MEVRLQAYTKITTNAQKYCGPIRLQDLKCLCKASVRECRWEMSAVGLAYTQPLGINNIHDRFVPALRTFMIGS